ncbi:ppdK [Symbiodinium microadriaticum]|nr:ppdK [Symbiodinium microadriaticum]
MQKKQRAVGESEGFHEHGMPDDDDPGFGMKTATLRDYQRKHHAEVTALSQVVEAIRDMQETAAKTSGNAGDIQVHGWVELFVPHYPCSSCTGALVQFAARHPQISVRVGHDDWRHWLRRLDKYWDPHDERHHLLSINARQLRDLDKNIGEAIPENYRMALRGTLGATGIAGERPPMAARGSMPPPAGYPAVNEAAQQSEAPATAPEALPPPLVRQTFY